MYHEILKYILVNITGNQFETHVFFSCPTPGSGKRVGQKKNMLKLNYSYDLKSSRGFHLPLFVIGMSRSRAT